LVVLSDLAICDLLPDEVIARIYVLAALVENRVLAQLDRALVVDEDLDSLPLLVKQFAEQSLKPHCLTC
jgi:hypothetical protein